MANSNIAIEEPSTVSKRVDTEQVDIGGTLVERERMQVSGVSSGDIAPVSSVSGLMVQVSSNSSNVNVSGSSVALVAGSTMTVSFTAGSTVAATLQGGQSSAIQGAPTAVSSAWPVTLAANSTGISLLYDVDSSATTVENVIGVSLRKTSSVAGSNEFGSTADPLAVLLQDSTATVTIQGNTTVALAAGSTMTVSFTAGSSVAVSIQGGQSTALLTTASTVAVLLSGGQSSVTIEGGQSTAIISTASRVRIESTATLAVSLTTASTVAVSMTTNSTVVVQQGPPGPTPWTVRSHFQTNQLAQGSTLITVQRANISFNTSGAQTIVSSVANAVIRVLGWNLVTTSTTVLTWFSGTTGGSTLAGPYSFAANGGISVPVTEFGWFQTSSGVALTLKSEAASSVGGNIVYVQSTSF
mgnify:CR=1 FL=1